MDSLNSSRNPSLLTTVPSFNHSHADSIISSLLSFPDSSPISIGSSFDRVLDKALASVSYDDSVQDRLVDRTIELASLLLESTKRCHRKRASIHNSHSWFLPPELTIKVFSMLDTKSLMQATACCTMFNKCAMDRLCYSNIDLTTSSKHADDGIVYTMIHRAGKELRSRLRCLRLYNIIPLNSNVLRDTVSACSNITDLGIVGLFKLTEELFKSLAKKCRLIENLFLESYVSHAGSNTESALVELMSSCPNLSSLTLIGFAFSGEMSRNLAEGFRKLKYMNLSRSPTFDGRFLRDLGHNCKDGPLKTLILRNCPSLMEKEVVEFCNSLLDGDFKSMRHIDVSNNPGLVSLGRKRSNRPNFPVEKLKEERPGVTFVADFASTRSRVCNETEEEELKLIEMMEVEDDDEEDDDDLLDDLDDDDVLW